MIIMALPIPTGELIGQSITINCTEQEEEDFYLGQSVADLSTEYDLTKGVDITFDGQLHKNVPVEFISDEGAFMIGEAGGHSPLFDKYPFFILLGLDTPSEISIHIGVLELYAKTQGEHTFTITEGSGSGRVMTLSGASRTYSHTAEPRFVLKANKTSELPEITSADAGKVLGITEDGKIAPVEGGGGVVPIDTLPNITLTAEDVTKLQNGESVTFELSEAIDPNKIPQGFIVKAPVSENSAEWYFAGLNSVTLNYGNINVFTFAAIGAAGGSVAHFLVIISGIYGSIELL